MTYLDIRLDDGRAAGPPDFSVTNPTVPLSADRRRAFSLAWRYRGQSEGKSIVLAKNRRLIGYAFGHEDWGSAMAAAIASVKRAYRFYGWPLLPQCGVVAVMRPFPAVRLYSLYTEVGVDTIVSAERLMPDPDLLEQPWIDNWLGIQPAGTEERAPIFVLPQYELLRVKQYDSVDMSKFQVHKKTK